MPELSRAGPGVQPVPHFNIPDPHAGGERAVTGTHGAGDLLDHRGLQRGSPQTRWELVGPGLLRPPLSHLEQGLAQSKLLSSAFPDSAAGPGHRVQLLSQHQACLPSPAETGRCALSPRRPVRLPRPVAVQGLVAALLQPSVRGASKPL